jgi:hypothetical protein
MHEPPDDKPLVELRPPLTSVAWSSDFVAQSLEILVVALDGEGAHHLHPIHAETLRVGWPPDRKPGDIVLDAVGRFGLEPLLVHSTSWRHEDGRLVLTYVAAVEMPDALNAYLVDEPVARVVLARRAAFGPPPAIGVTQVVEHAFRPLSWLVKDDAVVGERLAA